MISNRWIEKRRASWDRLRVLIGTLERQGVRKLPAGELREMALLYRQVASDLSALRQERTARTLEAELNQLLAQAHAMIYSRRKTGFSDLWHFFSQEYPRLFRQLLPFTLTSLLLFLAGAVVGSLLTLARPDFKRHFLGPAMTQTIERREMWTESVNSMAPQASSAIMTNNLAVTFTIFAAGITAGIGTIYMIAWNGVLIGVIATACHQAHMSVKLWSFVATHGSLEIPAIIIAGGSGLRLAYGLLFPGIFSRRHSLYCAGSDAVRLISGVIPVLAIAGMLEGFFSPSAAPVWLKFATALLLFTLLVLWLWSRPVDQEADVPSSESGAVSPLLYKSALSLISR
jgi:uncharacterized membrane protein SpoIIM required for sporulation